MHCRSRGYLAETGDEFPVITLTAKAPAVLFHGEQVTMQERAATAQETQAKRRASRKRRPPAPHFRKRTIRCWQA